MIWIDAQLPPSLANWITDQCNLPALPLRDLGLRDADDASIFDQARSAQAIVITKDSDFVALLQRHGPPPKVIWVTCGNTSNVRLKEVLAKTLGQALELLAAGESLVEIRDVFV